MNETNTANSVDNTLLEKITDTLSSTRYYFIFREEHGPRTVIQFLTEQLPDIDPSSWPSRFSFGGVHVNGAICTEDIPLPNPSRVEYYKPKYELVDAQNYYPVFQDNFLMYQDKDLAIAFKPAGLPTLPSKEQYRFTLKSYIELSLGRSVHLPSRLDTATSGLVPISLSERMNSFLQRLFERKVIVKRYLLGVSSLPNFDNLTVDLPIGRDERHSVLRKICPATGVRATTTFSALSKSESNSLLLARPFTGRTHQIRVHAHHLKLPIRGDIFYDGEASDELELCCFELQFYHPFLRQALSFQVPEDLRPSWLRRYEPALADISNRKEDSAQSH